MLQSTTSFCHDNKKAFIISDSLENEINHKLSNNPYSFIHISNKIDMIKEPYGLLQDYNCLFLIILKNKEIEDIDLFIKRTIFFLYKFNDILNKKSEINNHFHENFNIKTLSIVIDDCSKTISPDVFIKFIKFVGCNNLYFIRGIKKIYEENKLNSLKNKPLKSPSMLINNKNIDFFYNYAFELIEKLKENNNNNNNSLLRLNNFRGLMDYCALDRICNLNQTCNCKLNHNEHDFKLYNKLLLKIIDYNLTKNINFIFSPYFSAIQCFPKIGWITNFLNNLKNGIISIDIDTNGNLKQCWDIILKKIDFHDDNDKNYENISNISLIKNKSNYYYYDDGNNDNNNIIDDDCNFIIIFLNTIIKKNIKIKSFRIKNFILHSLLKISSSSSSSQILFKENEEKYQKDQKKELTLENKFKNILYNNCKVIYDLIINIFENQKDNIYLISIGTDLFKDYIDIELISYIISNSSIKSLTLYIDLNDDQILSIINTIKKSQLIYVNLNYSYLKKNLINKSEIDIDDKIKLYKKEINKLTKLCINKREIPFSFNVKSANKNKFYDDDDDDNGNNDDNNNKKRKRNYDDNNY